MSTPTISSKEARKNLRIKKIVARNRNQISLKVISEEIILFALCYKFEEKSKFVLSKIQKVVWFLLAKFAFQENFKQNPFLAKVFK